MPTNPCFITLPVRTERSSRYPVRWAVCGMLFMFLPGCSGCDAQSASEARSATVDPPRAQQEDAGSLPDSPPREPATPSTPAKRQSPSPPMTTAKGPPGSRESHGDSNSKFGSGTPAEALKQARDFHRDARHSAQLGDSGAAYRETVQAWELVNQFPKDAQCAALAGTLLTEMETLGEQANRRADTGDTSQPLLVR